MTRSSNTAFILSLTWYPERLSISSTMFWVQFYINLSCLLFMFLLGVYVIRKALFFYGLLEIFFFCSLLLVLEYFNLSYFVLFCLYYLGLVFLDIYSTGTVADYFILGGDPYCLWLL